MKNELEKIPGVVVSPLEGTYLMWVDFSSLIKDSAAGNFLEENCGFAFHHGEWFARSGYTGFVRINLATNREIVRRAAYAIAQQFGK